MKSTPLFVVLAVVAAAFLGCSSSKSKLPADSELTQVTLMLNWYPEAEHGGFYAAKVHGIFEKYGLDVAIQPGGPNAPVAQELLTGRVEFAIGNADDVLLFRQQDAEIVALMAAIQDTPRCIMVRDTSSVTDLKHLAGLRLQANAGRPFLDFMKAEGLLEGVEVVPYPGTVVNFVTDENTAIQAYSFSEPMVAEEQGVKSRKLMLSSAGFNPYASCLITTEKYAAENNDLVSRMVVACREGWQHYLEDAGETNVAILEDNQHGMSLKALEFGVRELKPLCIPPGMQPEQVGQMTLQRWSQLTEQFKQLGLIDAEHADPQAVFTTKFINRAAAQ